MSSSICAFSDKYLSVIKSKFIGDPIDKFSIQPENKPRSRYKISDKQTPMHYNINKIRLVHAATETNEILFDVEKNSNCTSPNKNEAQ